MTCTGEISRTGSLLNFCFRDKSEPSTMSKISFSVLYPKLSKNTCLETYPMSERHLFLLSPYRLPTSHQIYLNEDEMSAWLSGYTVLWHPALLRMAAGPPKVDSSYDHDFPSAGDVFAIPEAPPLFQPDDWADRVEQSGALRFRAGADRTGTLAELKQAVEASAHFADPETRGLLDLPLEKIRPFFAIGFGYIMIECLFDAMEHEHLLAVEEFWQHVQRAVEAQIKPDNDEEVRNHLQEAAKLLISARRFSTRSTSICSTSPFSIPIGWMQLCLLL